MVLEALNELMESPLYRELGISISDDWLETPDATETEDNEVHILEHAGELLAQVSAMPTTEHVDAPLAQENETPAVELGEAAPIQGTAVSTTEHVDAPLGGETDDTVDVDDPSSIESINGGVQETLLSGDAGLRLAHAEGQTPLPLLLDSDSEFLAFPKIM
ncbi:hypothetical protein BJV82DRAFT_665813 [Fennellomyces sp. T-0311]|nr:hypothetical protein BJV82DRAFT_665813 [Fennellomyces sp. T-0311]